MIRATNRIMMLDSPGVVPFIEKDDVKHVLIGSLMFSEVKNPDLAACGIIAHCNSISEKIIPQFYGVVFCSEPYDQVEAIAKKRNLVEKGGVLDTVRAARVVIQDWQTGKIHLA